MKKLIAIIFLSSLMIISACSQSPTGTPEKPVASSSKPAKRIPQKKDSDIVPTLTIADTKGKSELKLRSQTAKYVNDDKSKIEVILGDTFALTCDEQNPKLNDDDKVFKIALETVDGKAIKQGDSTKNGRLKLSGNFTINSIANEIKSENDFQVTSINDSIIRGSLNIKVADITYSGEYFSAICKN